ncbi:MAG: hypothetical protein WCI26_00105 [Acidimicrobiales bacterium]
MGHPGIDPEELLEQLKAEHQVLQWEPLQPSLMVHPPAGEAIRNRTSLEYLHRNWALPDAFDPAEGGAGPRGRLLALWGRMTYAVLRRYLHDERDLIAHMVRVNEGLEQRCDELSARVQQLRQDMIDHQVADAKNMTRLALWLHLDPPPPATSADSHGEGSTGTPSTTAKRKSEANSKSGAAAVAKAAKGSAAQR